MIQNFKLKVPTLFLNDSTSKSKMYNLARKSCPYISLLNKKMADKTKLWKP